MRNWLRRWSGAVVGYICSWLRQWWFGAVIGLILVAAGLMGLHHFHEGFRYSLAEAIFIAGILTLAVDPFLKHQLLREVSRDTFHYFLGFYLPIEIRERLREIVTTTTLYRRDMTAIYTFSDCDLGVKIDVETRFQIVNPTPRTLRFPQYLAFDEGEHPTLKSVGLSGNPNYGKNAHLSEKDDEKMVWQYTGRKIKIKPEKSGERYWVTSQYSLEFPRSFFHVMHFGQPTIGFTLTIHNNCDRLKISASPASKQSDSEWVYSRLFMPGDAVYVRWRSMDIAAASS